MNEYREALEQILSEKINVVTIDSEKEFIYIEKSKNGWRFAITKSLLKNTELIQAKTEELLRDKIDKNLIK